VESRRFYSTGSILNYSGHPELIAKAGSATDMEYEIFLEETF
jgi:hypothetical protein